MATILQTLNVNVNGGEMSPQMAGRTDSDKYKTGARILENFIVKPYGGISKRPGTEFLGFGTSNGNTRLEPFKRSATENYILEFSDNNIRVWEGGANAGPLLLNLSDFSTYNVRLWATTTNYSVGDIIYDSSGKYVVCTVAHTSGSSTRPESGADWQDYWSYHTVAEGSILQYNTGSYNALMRCIVSHSTTAGGNASGPNFSYWTTLGAYDNTFQTYYMDIYSPYDEDDVMGIQTCLLNDVMFLAHKSYYPMRLSRFSDSRWVLEKVPFQYAPTLDPNSTTSSIQTQFDYPFFDQDAWATSTAYVVGDRVEGSTGNYYVCKLNHTSSASDEPGVGGSWNTYWTLITYSVGSRVINSQGRLYTCHTAYTPTNTTTGATGEPGVTSGSWQDYWNLGTGAYKVPSWANSTNYVVGKKVQRGKVVYECIRAHKSSAPSAGILGGTVGGNRPTDGQYWTRYWKIAVADTDLGGVNYKLTSDSDVFQSSDVDSVWTLSLASNNYYSSLNIAGASTGPLGPTDEFFIQGSYIVETRWDSGAAFIGTLTLEESTDGVTWGIVKQWITLHSSEGNISYSGEAPTNGAWYRLSGDKTSSSGQRTIRISPVVSTLTLPFKITSYVSSKEVNGYFVMPNNQFPPISVIGTSTSIFRKPAFTTYNGFPRSVTFHENRIWWGGVDKEPARLWGSQKDDFYIHLLGTDDVSALDITLGSTSTNKIQWIRSFNKMLVVGTEGEIFSVDSGETDSSINATNIRARLRVRYGTCEIPGVVTGESLLFFQRGKKRLREFAYVFESDSFSAPDMTLLAEHVNSNGFVQSAFQGNLEPVLWSVTSNGCLVGFSYDRAQGITAWHRHITGDRDTFYNNNSFADKFTSVASIYGGDSQVDEVWFAVRRYSALTGYRMYIERFSPSLMNFVYGSSWSDLSDTDMWKYTDCHKRLEERTVSSVSGSEKTYYHSTTNSDYLFGRNVQVSVDRGSYWNNSGLSDSSLYEYGFHSPDPAFYGVNINGNDLNGSKRVTVGLPIFSVYCPTRPDFQLQDGSSQGRKIRYNRFAFKVWRSIGGSYVVLNGLNDSAVDAQNVFEKKPLFTDSFQNIEYDSFNYALSLDYPRKNTTDYIETYTGQTKYQHTNSDYSYDPAILIVHKYPTPFNILGIINYIEISGN